MNDDINFEDQNFKGTATSMNDFFKDVNFLKPKRNFVLAIVFTFLLLGYTYFSFPLYNYTYDSSILFAMFVTFVYLFLLAKNKKRILVLIPVFFVIYVGLSIFSNPILRSNDYYNLLGDVKIQNYNDTPPNIDNALIPVVDEKLAMNLGDKVLGTDIGLGSQFTVGEYYFVNTKDDLAWVAPLEPRSFFKWLQNIDGSPGYVYVSATDPNDVRLVQEINGKPIKLKYTNSSFFSNNIYRHTYLPNNMTKGLTDFSFEIDDEGNPFWVVSTYKPEIGISGYDTSGAVIIDAQTGEQTSYDDISQIPQWAERIQPTALIGEQVNYWGSYKNGWLNTIIGQKEMITTTNGHSYILVEGEPYYYTGLTSITNDQSTVGFMLVNLRTKESYFYSITGATETAAMSSAEGQVQQFGYKATFPVLLNEFGKATYFMTLKDVDGLLKQYAYVSVENYNIVGVGSSKDEAKANYYNALKASGTVNTNELELTTISNTIERINYIDGDYFIKLSNANELYKVSSDINSILPITSIGDTVTMQFSGISGPYLEVLSFKNETLGN